VKNLIVKIAHNQLSYEDILRVWQEADTLPSIEHAWLFDHPMPIMRADPSGPCLDGWTLLAVLAAQTRRLRLGLMVASNANQPPALLAKRAATLDIISHGRLEFGLGAGGVEREHTAYGTDFFPDGERVRRLGEACEIIRHMWTEPVVNFEGRYYHLSETYCEPKPIQKPTPPFVIGGVGEKLILRIVAQHADVWNYPLFPLGTVEEFQQCLPNYVGLMNLDLMSLPSLN
jgi:alkanesulfonate monooxygenase SsuD/methylene tetrahydromethanopterin reductase-like flavin-dependent oxidoreductase (luciferase family)